MKCPRCQTDNPDTSRFCGNCAAPLTSTGGAQPSFTVTLATPDDQLSRGMVFANRYEIIEELGAGGMGRVYRAEDTKVKEQVALKLLRPEISADRKTIDRFRNELKVARRIRHKNVTGMFDLGEEGGIHYITMEYVSGEDLRSLIRRVGQLPIPKSVAIAGQICEGLSEAHRLGTVHRDLKPSNVMIDRDGNVRIMDFGIARSVGLAGVTEAGIMIGTPEYMSPEQAEAGDVDQRSDIYSLGIILYEMLTGRRPFEAETSIGFLLKHRSERPQDPRELNVLVPESLSRTILRCLEKDKEKRWANVEELLAALRSGEEPMAETLKASDTRSSIAVLPFTDMSPEKDQGYFAEGIAEELINALAHIQGLRVVARTSAFVLKGMNLDIREIGRKLDVRAVLEGSVRKAGNRLRVTAQLINVEDGFHLWSERYDREMADIFAIQDEISSAIVDSLKVTLRVGEMTALRKRPTDDPEAYNLYLKGLYFVARPSPESYGKALDSFQAALVKDPDFALAYAGIANVYGGLGVMNLAPPAEMWPKAKAALQKALSLNEDLAEAHAVAAQMAFWYEWDWEAAGRSFDRVLALNPGDAMSHGMHAWYCLNRGRFDETIGEIKTALELDPLMPLFYAWSVGLHWSVGKPDEAIVEFAKALELDPNQGLAYFHAGMAYSQRGLTDEALAAFERGKKLVVFPGWIEGNLGLIYLKKGDREKAERMLEDMLEKKSRVINLSSVCIAWLAGLLGKLELAFEFLDKAYEERDTLMAFIHIYTKWTCPPLLEEPRFKNVLTKMKLDT
jgi:TolB-like protein/Tfp pilus assembly protein PilF/tRNA A-37 threonylcarbamoyl transferase component Bud32